MSDDARTFLADRADWLCVDVIERADEGWDVAVIVDGTYFGEELMSRAEAIEHFTEWLGRVLAHEGIETHETLRARSPRRC